MTKIITYIGTYTAGHSGKAKGLHIAEYDSETGALTPIKDGGIVEVGPNPSWVTIDSSRGFLFCANEKPTGAVSAFKINKSTGALTPINSVPSEGADPCHLTLDPSGKFLICANYSSGTISVLPIGDDGALGKSVQTIQLQGKLGTHTKRQEASHAHSADFGPGGSRFFFSCDLGTDSILHYTFDGAAAQKLSPNPASERLTEKAGAGPRHILFHPNQKIAFVMNELDCSISVLEYDGASGVFKKAIETKPTLPAGYMKENTTAELAITKDGKFLFGSNRGHDSIVTFRVHENEEQGKILEYVNRTPTGGEGPRHFTLSPDDRFLLVGNQNTDTITVFKVVPDKEGGVLEKAHSFDFDTPICIAFLQ